MSQNPAEQQLNPSTMPDILASLATFVERADGDTLEPTVDTQALLLEAEYTAEPSPWLTKEVLDRGAQACAALRQIDEFTQIAGWDEAIDTDARLQTSTVRRVAAWAATFGLEGEHADEIFEMAAWIEASTMEDPASLAAEQGEWALAQPASIVEVGEKPVDRTTACVQQLEALRASGDLPTTLTARSLYNLLTGTLATGRLDDPTRKLIDRVLAKSGGHRIGNGVVTFASESDTAAEELPEPGRAPSSDAEKGSADAQRILRAVDAFAYTAVCELDGADPGAQTYTLGQVMRELELPNSERVRRMLGDNLRNHRIEFVDRMALVVNRALDGAIESRTIKYKDLRELVAEAIERAQIAVEQRAASETNGAPQKAQPPVASAAGNIAISFKRNSVFLEPLFAESMS